MKAKRIPVEVDAYQLKTCKMIIESDEGMQIGDPGDWLIFDTDGEPYFCRDSVFQKTYQVKPEKKRPQGVRVTTALLASPRYYTHIKESPTLEECLATLYEKYPNCTATKDQVREVWEKYHPFRDDPPECQSKRPRARSRPPQKKDIHNDDPRPAIDAKGNCLMIGSKVKQVAGNAKAYGAGDVKAIADDGRVHVKFPTSTKVLPASQFEVIDDPARS